MKLLIISIMSLIAGNVFSVERTLEMDIAIGTPSKIYENSKPYIKTIISIAKRLEVEPKLIYSMAWRETHFKIRDSRVGAKGLMQVMPTTRQETLDKNKDLIYQIKLEHSFDMISLGEDVIENIIVGTLYIKKLIAEFDGNMKYAIIAYNMGPARIRYRLKKGYNVGRNHQYFNKINYSLRRLASYP